MLENFNDPTLISHQLLTKPGLLINQFSPSHSVLKMISNARQTAEQIIHGIDDRLLVLVGPCSIHDVDSALEYAHLLKETSESLADDLFIIMRVYFEKPRTTLGWKGFIKDPHLDNTFDINHGLQAARKLLLDLSHIHVPAGTEFLDTITPAYLSDLISWCAIGARTSESQIHRELASSLPMPVGFKNNTDGNIKIAIDGAETARYPHPMLTINTEGSLISIHTPGNLNTHIILRGSTLSSNFDTSFVSLAMQQLTKARLSTRVMIDCSHGNSFKHSQNQHIAANNICDQLREGSQSICGVMLESHLVAGNQRLEKNKSLVYGQSITDDCIGWGETVSILEKLASSVKQRRNKQPSK